MRKHFLAFITILINFSQKNKDKILFLIVIIIGIYFYIQKIPTITCEGTYKPYELLIKMIYNDLIVYYKSTEFKDIFGNNLYYKFYINEKYIVNYINQIDWSLYKEVIQDDIDEPLHTFIKVEFNKYVIKMMSDFDQFGISMIKVIVIKFLEYQQYISNFSPTIPLIKSNMLLLSFLKTLLQNILRWLFGGF